MIVVVSSDKATILCPICDKAQPVQKIGKLIPISGKRGKKIWNFSNYRRHISKTHDTVDKHRIQPSSSIESAIDSRKTAKRKIVDRTSECDDHGTKVKQRRVAMNWVNSESVPVQYENQLNTSLIMNETLTVLDNVEDSYEILYDADEDDENAEGNSPGEETAGPHMGQSGPEIPLPQTNKVI